MENQSKKIVQRRRSCPKKELRLSVDSIPAISPLLVHAQNLHQSPQFAKKLKRWKRRCLLKMKHRSRERDPTMIIWKSAECLWRKLADLWPQVTLKWERHLGGLLPNLESQLLLVSNNTLVIVFWHIIWWSNHSITACAFWSKVSHYM